MKNQDNLRQAVKKLKWQDGVSYKEIAEDLLEMNINSFYNFVNGFCDLGYERAKLLYSFLSDREE